MALEKYLQDSKFIDWRAPAVLELAHSLGRGHDTDTMIAKACFEWVRDNIRHSNDFRLNPVTCKASDVLEHKTGYCYAKSHLLAALLRANTIPAGLCYQRLSIDDTGPPYSLHGLNAVHLQEFGWYRIDPRGNKAGINAQFTPPVEQLAFPIQFREEANLPEIWPEPLPAVVQVLSQYDTYQDVSRHLPDIDIIPASKSLC